MSTFLKPTKVVNTALGLLQREITLPQLVWRDAVGDFAGVLNDTISIRVPSYAPARTRVLRSGAVRTQDSLNERKVDVTLDTDVYKDVPISDEQLSLDIIDFGIQVLNPILIGIGLGLEQKLADTINGASYQNTITYSLGAAGAEPYKQVAVPARQFLNNAFVPQGGRVIVCGSQLEAAFLTSDQFIRASYSGDMSNQAFREAHIGRIAGFDVYTSPAINPANGYAFHSTAFVMSQRAPLVPAGAPWGASESYQGLAVRTVRVFDPSAVQDRFVADAWVGANTVTDFGHYDADPAAGGRFIPGADPANPITGQANAWQNDLSRLVRAVKITVTA